MAKKTQALPSVESDEPIATLEPPENPVRTVRISVPLGHPRDGYRSGHINLHLNGPQRETMKRLRDALYQTDACMSNGKPVSTTADVVRWLLDRISEE